MPRKNFFPKEPIIPSRIKDCCYIRYRGKTEESDSEDDEASDDTEDEDDPEDTHLASLLRPFLETTERMQKLKIMKEKNMLGEIYDGKWMLFYDNKKISLARGMTEHDYMWQFAKQLVDDSENTKITSVYCSTGNPFPYGTDPKVQNGIIGFCTEDYRNKLEVRKAAEAIRQLLYYPKNMFYKTDDATISGLFRHFGHRNVSLYKFTANNKMYERDRDVVHNWNPVWF